MQFLDGRGDHWHGLTGAFLVGAAVSIAACALLGWMLTRWRVTSEAIVQDLAPSLKSRLSVHISPSLDARIAFHSSTVFQSYVLKQGCSTTWG